MSDPNMQTREGFDADPLLAALHALPSRAMDASPEARLQRQARAAYLRSFGSSDPRSAWQASAAGFVGRAAVPMFLAGIVGVYMMWAIAAATAIVH